MGQHRVVEQGPFPAIVWVSTPSLPSLPTWHLHTVICGAVWASTVFLKHTIQRKATRSQNHMHTRALALARTCSSAQGRPAAVAAPPRQSCPPNLRAKPAAAPAAPRPKVPPAAAPRRNVPGKVPAVLLYFLDFILLKSLRGPRSSGPGSSQHLREDLPASEDLSPYCTSALSNFGAAVMSF